MSTRDKNSLIQRIAVLPGKVRERGTAWAARRSVEIIRDSGRRAAHVFAHTLIWALLRKLSYISAFAQDTLVVTYDLEVYPISYDICWFLVCADFTRRRRGLTNLHCIFLPIGDHGQRIFPPGYDAVVDRASREWRFQNICVAMSQLVPPCNGVTVCNTRAQFNGLSLLLERPRLKSAAANSYPPLSMIYRDLIAQAATSRDWGLKAPEQGLRYINQWIDCHSRGRKLVVVTLRQYAVDIERNSRAEDWAAFLRGLDQSVYFPAIVPDTDHALEGEGGFEGITVFHEAAWNLGIRMALYETAYMNMFVNCGPASLCILNPRTNYMLFKVSVPGIHLASEETLREMGFEPNTQPPIATPRQRWVWEDDRREIIAREFAAMVKRIEGVAWAEAPARLSAI